MGTGRKSHQQHPSLPITETGHRPAPVGEVAKRPTLLMGDPLAVGSQAGTPSAFDDGAFELLPTPFF
jgi:hypothetical protein